MTPLTTRSSVYFLLAAFWSIVLVQAGPPVAIPMTYHVTKNKQKFIALAAYSDDITYREASHTDEVINFGIRYDDAITAWRIETLPAHGTLFDSYTEIDQTPYLVSDPDEVLYVPNEAYVGPDGFRFSVSDSQGISDPAGISLRVEAEVTLPKGIPALPAIFHTQAPVPAAAGNVETDDWYIDNSHPSATDTPQPGESSPRHGTPDVPRATIPPNNTSFVAGARVFLAGGVETPYQTRSGVTWHQWFFRGTSESPVYVIGINDGPGKPVITGSARGELRLQMEHTLFEGIDFRGLSIAQFEDLVEGHVVFRHCVIDRMNRGTTGAGIQVNRGNHKVFYDVHIKRAGFTEPDLSAENDVHGIQISASFFWVLDSLIHGSAGDAIQINNQASEGLYIARNKLHSDNENALDFKRRYDLIFVENDVWDYRAIDYRSSGSDGTPVLVNQDTPGQPPIYSTVSRNRIWDCNGAIRLQGQEIWTTDNVIWHVHQNANAPAADVAYAIEVGNNDHEDYTQRITNNTLHMVDGGIYIWAGDNSGVKDHHIVGNNFGELNGDSREPYHMRISGNHIEGTILDYNNYSSPLRVRWGSTLRDLAWMQANTANCAQSFENRDPMFADPDHFDLSLQPNSPLIDTNIEHVAYGEFFEQYGRSLMYDANNMPRPQEGGWDIGAFEYRPFCAVAWALWHDLDAYLESEDHDQNGRIDLMDYVAQINACTSESPAKWVREPGLKDEDSDKRRGG
ncbi:Ig-like domain-containing protein [Sulfidibacter corallicola]|uniref:Uncharacterized protein n=1 Tax=Sulfidibacter corallicola TaxID=2818388 RepID=A0A8A4TFK9_SULCO|nr:Ig-like domain-containing protein [Sulfidibacter corallicola]QTD48340.1 hypothetical protein J3U87_22400 [Sulfidibacter corallicola]